MARAAAPATLTEKRAMKKEEEEDFIFVKHQCNYQYTSAIVASQLLYK